MRKKTGFTLVEVMIAVGLMAAGGLALMKTNEIATQTNTAAQVGMSWQLKRFQIQDSLNTIDGCRFTLEGKRFGETIAKIKSKKEADLAVAGTSYPSSSNPEFEITSLTFKDTVHPPGFSYGVNVDANIEAIVTWKKNMAGKAKGSTTRFDFPVLVTVADATAPVTGCRGVDANFTALDACQMFGGTLFDYTGSSDYRCLNIDGFQGISAINQYNTAIGDSSLNADVSGTRNTAVGASALLLGTANTDNTAVGFSAGANSTAGQNTYLGSYAGLSNVTSIQNTVLGFRAMGSTAAGEGGSYNTAVGADALYANTTGTYNTAIGSSSLGKNTDGASNVAIGPNALVSNLTGSWNIAIGTDSLSKGKTQSQNIAIGANALQNNQSSRNTAVGYQSLMENQTGEDNLAIGAGALKNNTTGSKNSAGGTNSANNNSTGERNTAWGYQAMASNSSASDNVAIGSDALYFTNSGYNTAVGSTVLPVLLSGSHNTALGFAVMASASFSSQNVVIGANAMRESALAGEENVFIGHETGYYATGDNLKYNAVIGKRAGYRLTGPWNTFIGEQAGVNATSAETNTFIGAHAGLSVTTGKFNVALGANSLETSNAFTGEHNVCLGRYACQGLTGNESNRLEIRTGENDLGVIMKGQGGLAQNKLEIMGDLYVLGKIYSRDGIDSNWNPNVVPFPWSDRRLKNSIQSYDNAISDIMKLNIKRYRWNKSELLDIKNKKYQTENIGVIAQEVQQSMPNLIHKNEKEILSVDVNQIFFAGIGAIQQQQKQIEKQEEEIADLKRELASLKEIVQDLSNKK